MFKSKTLSVVLITTLILAACGGGNGNAPTANSGSPASGGSTNGQPGNNTTTGTPPNQNVSTPVYATDSDFKQAFFSDLNSVRNQWGISLLAQNVDLDNAAMAHAHYLGVNLTAAEEAEVDPTTNLLYAHSENPALSGFSGATPQQRAGAAGYMGSVGEVGNVDPAGSSPLPSTATLGHTYFGALMNTVYHRDILMNDCLRDIGVGYASPSELVVELGVVGSPTPLPANLTYTYPIDGATNVFPLFNPLGELPNPLPASSGLVGAPISFAVGTTHKLVVTTFTLVDNLKNTVPLQLIDAANDQRQNSDGPNIAVIVPLAKLNLGTKYTAMFTGTADGTMVNKTFTFTTLPAVINGPAQSTYTITSGAGITIPFLAPSGVNSISIDSYSGGQISNLQYAPNGTGITITSVTVSSPATLTFALSDAIYPDVPTKTVTIIINP